MAQAARVSTVVFHPDLFLFSMKGVKVQTCVFWKYFSSVFQFSIYLIKPYFDFIA